MSDSAGTSMHKRIASVIFGMLMLFIVLSSAFFIALIFSSCRRHSSQEKSV